MSLVLSIGTTVVTITATDADDQTYGNSAKLVYSILQGQPYFSVDSENGEPHSKGTTNLFLPEWRHHKKEGLVMKDTRGKAGDLHQKFPDLCV